MLKLRTTSYMLDVMLVVDGDTMCMVRYTDRAIAMLMPSGRAPEKPRDVTKWQQSYTHVTILEVLLYMYIETTTS